VNINNQKHTFALLRRSCVARLSSKTNVLLALFIGINWCSREERFCVRM